MRIAVALAAAALLAACPGGRPEDVSQHAPSQSSTSTQNPQAVPGKSAAMNPITPPQTALPSASPVTDVQLLEYQIRMADTLRAGPQHFRIADAGDQQHSFAIEGPGVSAQLPSQLSRGDTTELAVTLKPGTYTVWCPVDKHRGKGMERTITVK